MQRSRNGLFIATACLAVGCGGSGGDEVFREPAENHLPTADFTATPTSGKAPLGVEFDASRSNDPDGVIDRYSWDFGDGTTGSGRATTHDFANDGVFTVALLVTDNDGGQSATAATTITVNPNAPPVAAFDTNPVDPRPSPVTVTFDASASADSDGTITGYDWDFGNMQADAGRVVTHTFENDGVNPLIFTVTLTVTDDGGSASTNTRDVTVLPLNQPPQASFSGCPITACSTPGSPPFFAPYTVDFDASASQDIDGTITQYEWNFGDGTSLLKDDAGSPDFMVASHEYVDSGAFVVELIVSDNFGETDTTASELTIDNLPPVALFTSTPQPGPAPFEFMFDATASGDSDGLILEYEWQFGDGLVGRASVDPETEDIIDSTLTGVGSGTGITADHTYSTIGSEITTRRIPAAAGTSVVTGDMDGNEVTDIIVVGNWLEVNHAFFDIGAASPLQSRRPQDVAAELDATLDLALADVNGDDFPDLLTANGIVNPDSTLAGRENRIYLWNDDEGSFDDALSISPTDLDTSTSIAVGNINTDIDAFPLIVVGNRGAANRVYLGDGSGNFGPGADISTDIGETADIVLVDVDDDDDLDVLTAELDGTNRLYPGDGLGGFGPGFDITSDAHASSSLAVSDVDDDGDPDLVVGNGDDNGGAINRLYLNQCGDPCAADSNVFAGASGIDIAEDAEITAGVSLDDVDGDGDPDLIVGNVLQPSRLYLNHRNAAPFDMILFNDRLVDNPECEPDPDTPEKCECNVDAPDADTCTTTPVASGEFLFEGRTSAVLTVDLDENSAPDLVATGFGDANTVYLSTCNGACSTRDSNPYAGSFPMDFPFNDTEDIAVGDVDGDGDLDLVTASVAGAGRVISSSQQTGFALTNYVVASASDSGHSVVLADMDGDNDLDLLTGNAGQTNKYYANTCNDSCGLDAALFDDPLFAYAISTDLANTSSLAVGDVDGDGDLDVVAGNGIFSDQPNRVYINQCTEEFGAAGCPADSNVFQPGILPPTFFEIGNELNNTQSIVLGDLDQDGLPDLIVGNDAQVNFVYINTCDDVAGCALGENPFPVSGVAIDASTAFHSQSVRLHDLDGDTDLDLVVGNSGETNRVFFNDLIESGSFSFRSGSDIGNDSDSTFSIGIGDLDGDGNADIVAGNEGANRVYYSDPNPDPGNEIFSSETVGTIVTTDDDSSTAVIIVDIGDGGSDNRADVLVANSGAQNVIYYNDGTHLVRLKVTDNAGASTESVISIEAQSQ